MYAVRDCGRNRQSVVIGLILAALAFIFTVAQGDAHHRCWHKAKTCGGPSPVKAAAPETTIDSGPAEAIDSDSVSFSFSSSESGSTFECRLDVLTWTDCTSPKSYSGLWNEVHTFEVRAKDAGGNIDTTPARQSFRVEAPTPEPTPTPDPSTSPSPITAWRAPGVTPLSDTDAASRVRPAAENRPGNADENQYRPTAAERP